MRRGPQRLTTPMSPPTILIQTPSTPAELDTVRGLFREYEKDLGISLCFQGFERELDTLPGRYAPPGGRLYLATIGGEVAGCIALRDITDDAARFLATSKTAPSAPALRDSRVCEMKRLYVRPAFRGHGVGRVLAQRLLDDARDTGYAAMRLDTMDTLKPAVELYRSLGFQPTPRYNNDEDPHTLFFSKALRS